MPNPLSRLLRKLCTHFVLKELSFTIRVLDEHHFRMARKRRARALQYVRKQSAAEENDLHNLYTLVTIRQLWTNLEIEQVMLLSLQEKLNDELKKIPQTCLSRILHCIALDRSAIVLRQVNSTLAVQLEALRKLNTLGHSH